MAHVKDAILNELADAANVAQFISYSPQGEQRFARVFGYGANHRFASIQEGVSALLARSAEQSVNVRSFDPENPKSRHFHYGLTNVSDVVAVLSKLFGEGLFTIVNETVDVHDGGVSGVALGDIIEFAPGETPRAVEKTEVVASFPRQMGQRLLELVYGFVPALDYPNGTRVEFSIHPIRRGVRNEHTIIWELEEVGETSASVTPTWPNNFSRFLGDKVFGLLVAHLVGLPVPKTIVFGRNTSPFAFGESTGTAEPWIRTCPVVQMPGKFTTKRGWLDPYALMAKEDPKGTDIASVLAQEGVDAKFSGAVIASSDSGDAGSLTIEGTSGFGDEFMIGRKEIVPLPETVVASVRELYAKAAHRLGAVRMEWVSDGHRVWVVQFHRGATASHGNIIVPGEAKRFERFDVRQGLEALRELVSRIPAGDGIVLVGSVGITSHFGDVLRRAKVPSLIERGRGNQPPAE